MRKLGIIAVLSMLVVALAAVPALAASPHFLGTPTATDTGTQLQVSGSVAGLGNENIDVVVTARGTADVTCTNPAGNVAPGQRTTVTATGSVSNLEVKNGRANFTVTTATPTVPNTPTCPNAKWTATVTDVQFTSYTIQVIQPAGSGNVVLSRTFQL
jgi:hypothetical protein